MWEDVQLFTIWILCLAIDLAMELVGGGTKNMPNLVSVVEWEMVNASSINVQVKRSYQLLSVDADVLSWGWINFEW